MNREEARRLAARFLMVGFAGEEVPPHVERLASLGTRNFVLFARNCVTVDGVKRLTHRLQEISEGEAIVAIDHEGGTVNRLRGIVPGPPSAMAISAAGDLRLTEEMARASARNLTCLGINVNFAPVVDVLADHRNPVLSTRVFSDDPSQVAEHAVATIRGHKAAGVAAVAKHFPGHGATPTDSHVGEPVVDRSLSQLRRMDLVPFRASIEAGVDGLMTSHVWYPALDTCRTPATMSPAVFRLIRDEMRFDGVVWTDDMGMDAVHNGIPTGEAAVRAVVAGCDVVTMSWSEDDQIRALEALADAIADGVVTAGRLTQTSERMARLRRNRGSHDIQRVESDSGPMKDVAARAITVVRDSTGMLPLQLNPTQRLAVVTFCVSGHVASTRGLGNRMADQVRARHADTVHVAVEETMEGIDAALSQLRSMDLVIVCTAGASRRLLQAGLVRTLQNDRKSLIVVAMTEPFDLLVMPDVECFVVAYTEMAAATEAATAVLFGELPAKGKLPVSIPGLFPRGHGLSPQPRSI